MRPGMTNRRASCVSCSMRPSHSSRSGRRPLSICSTSAAVADTASPSLPAPPGISREPTERPAFAPTATSSTSRCGAASSARATPSSQRGASTGGQASKRLQHNDASSPGRDGRSEARTQGVPRLVSLGAREDTASRRAARPGGTRLIVLEPLRAEHRPPRASQEAGFEQERHQLRLARGLAAEEDDLGTGDAGRAAPSKLGPRQPGAVGLRRVGRSDHERLGLLALLGPKLAEPLDGAAERELRAAETFDEVATPAETEGLERLQLSVDRAIAAGDPFSTNAVSGHDPMSLEDELRKRAAIWLSRKQTIRRRPAALGGGDSGRAPPREAPRPPLWLRHAVAAAGAQRRPGVVRDLAGPDEIPERR